MKLLPATLLAASSLSSLFPNVTAFSAIDPRNSAGLTSKTTGWDMDQITPGRLRIEGETRHTFSFGDTSSDCVQVALESPNDRPVASEINLWLGPDYTPFSLYAHSENGSMYPIQSLIGTKGKYVNVELKNTGSKMFPMNAACAYAIPPLSSAVKDIVTDNGGSAYIDGGAIRMYPFSAEVDQLQVLLKTDGKLLKAKIELLNGPNNVKQEYEVYASSGDVTSLFVVFETKGAGNSIRVKNLASQEYPLDFYWRASVMGNKDAGQPMWNY